MKAVYLVDANLPFRVPIWQNSQFAFVLKLNPKWNDEEIWKYDKKNNLVIVTKDKDFLLKQVIAGAPPNIVQVKFGNLKLNEFIKRIETVWPEVESLLQSHTIINIYAKKIEAIK
jgi:predicted nuclease of predicted toxin-antitoxin system